VLRSLTEYLEPAKNEAIREGRICQRAPSNLYQAFARAFLGGETMSADQNSTTPSGNEIGQFGHSCIPSVSGENVGEFNSVSARNILSLGAAPCFALLAIASALQADSLAAICTSTAGPIPLNMVTMYLVMSFFHLGPWLELVGKTKVKTYSKDE
jgi:hypothetical protein